MHEVDIEEVVLGERRSEYEVVMAATEKQKEITRPNGIQHMT